MDLETTEHWMACALLGEIYIPLIVLKKTMPTGVRNFEVFWTATVGTVHDWPLHNFNSNLYSR